MRLLNLNIIYLSNEINALKEVSSLTWLELNFLVWRSFCLTEKQKDLATKLSSLSHPSILNELQQVKSLYFSFFKYNYSEYFSHS